MPRDFTIGITDNCFEEDSNEDFMPVASPSSNAAYFETDSNGDIQPI
jgi:hypothetical protein